MNGYPECVLNIARALASALRSEPWSIVVRAGQMPEEECVRRSSLGTVLVVRDGARGWPRRCRIGVRTVVFMGSLVSHIGGG